MIRVDQISFDFPGPIPALRSIDLAIAPGEAVAIVGANGSGKSTFLKLLIGDLEPEEGVGTAWKHHNLRLSYVAQQALHHLEDYVTVTPINYIQERFRQGLDAEVAKLKTLAITEEEEKEMSNVGAIHGVVGRQQRGRALAHRLLLARE